MQNLRARDGSGARALEFAVLTATRTGEVLGAYWSEFDLRKRLWTIPAARTKVGKEHRVPLSDAALAVLHQMEKVKTGPYVFPGARPNSPLSNMSFLMVLRRMGRPELTGHGFRSSFRTWAAECTGYLAEVAEMALGHVAGNKVELAYRRGDLFRKRAQLMEAWGRYCGTPPATGAVVRLAR